MGNKNLKIEDNSAISGSTNVQIDSDPVKQYKSWAKKDSFVMVDPLNGLRRYVPLITDIGESSILKRRKVMVRIPKTISSANVSIGMRRSKPIKRHASSSNDLTGTMMPNTYNLEILDSPTLLNELMGGGEGVKVRRLNF